MKLNNCEEGNCNIHFFYNIENLKRNPSRGVWSRLTSQSQDCIPWLEETEALAVSQDPA